MSPFSCFSFSVFSAFCNGRFSSVRAAVFTVAVSVAITPVVADEMQDVFDKAKTLSLEGPDYQFDVEIGVKDARTSGTVNPQAAPGERFSRHAPDQELSEELQEEVDELEREAGDMLWCQRLLDEVEGYSEARRDGDLYTYNLVLSVDTNSKEEKKFARHVNSTVTVSADDGAVLQYTMNAPKPFRPVMVAKIKRFDLVIDCQRSPDGRTFASNMRADIAGRAMMKSFEESQRRVISNLIALP